MNVSARAGYVYN